MINRAARVLKFETPSAARRAVGLRRVGNARSRLSSATGCDCNLTRLVEAAQMWADVYAANAHSGNDAQRFQERDAGSLTVGAAD